MLSWAFLNFNYNVVHLHGDMGLSLAVRHFNWQAETFKPQSEIHDLERIWHFDS